MSPIRYAAAAIALSVLGVAAWVALGSLLDIGGDACEVYCGPGSMMLPLALMVASPMLLVAAMGIAVRGLWVHRIRGQG